MNADHPEKDENRLKHLHPAFGPGADEQTLTSPARWQGGHVFRLHQPSRLPAFSRHYFPGDPLKLIDWKAYARSDLLLVREDKRPASGPVMVCLDSSPSMMWPHEALQGTLDERIPSKFEIAVRVALYICYQSIRLGDHVVLLTWQGETRESEPYRRIPCSDTTEVVQIFNELTGHGFTPKVLGAPSIPYNQVSRFERGYWISDGLGRSRLDWIAAAAKKSRGLLVMSSLENNLAWLEGATCYFDDSSEKKEYLGAELKMGNDIADSVVAWQRRLQQEAALCNSIWQGITDDTPVIQFQKELAADWS